MAAGSNTGDVCNKEESEEVVLDAVRGVERDEREEVLEVEREERLLGIMESVGREWADIEVVSF